MATSKSASETFSRLGMLGDRAMPWIDHIPDPNARKIMEQSDKTFGNRYIAVEAIREFHEKGDIIGDKIETIDWIMSLAKRGNSEAMNMIGILYHTGKVLPISTIEAEKWYCRATKAGNQSAAKNLGLMMAGTIYRGSQK